MNTQDYKVVIERRFLSGEAQSSLVGYISELSLPVEDENELIDFVEHHQNRKNLPQIIVSDRQLRDSVLEAAQALYQAS